MATYVRHETRPRPMECVSAKWNTVWFIYFSVKLFLLIIWLRLGCNRYVIRVSGSAVPLRDPEHLLYLPSRTPAYFISNKIWKCSSDTAALTLRPWGWCSRVGANMFSRPAGCPALSRRDLGWMMRWDVTGYPQCTTGEEGVPTMPCVASTSKMNTPAASELWWGMETGAQTNPTAGSGVGAELTHTQRDSDGHRVNSSFLENLGIARISSARVNEQRLAKFKPGFILG